MTVCRRQLKNVTVEQKLGDKIPLGLPLTDSTGKRVKTGYFIDGTKPTIVTLNYSSCPMLCSVQLNQLAQSLGELEMQIGKDFNILTVSIDPKETTATAAKTKQKYFELVVRKQPAAEQRLGVLHCQPTDDHQVGRRAWISIHLRS